MTITLIAVLVYITVYILIMALYSIIFKEQRLLQLRLKEMVSEGPHQKGLSTETETKSKSLLKVIISKTSKMFEAKSYTTVIQKELIKAGIPLKGEEFMAIRLLVTVGSGLLMLIVSSNLFIAVLIGAVGFVIPKFIVRIAQTKRLELFNNQIGDCLVVMANSMRAGFSFFQAMDMISKEMPNPIASEFSRVLREVNLGTPTEEALVNLAERVGGEDLDLIITAVLIQRQVGGNLSEVLDNISHTIRERIRIKGEIKTLTAQGKISGLVIGLLPIILGFILFFINRDYIMVLFTTSLGLALVVGAIISEILGLVLIKKIVDVDV